MGSKEERIGNIILGDHAERGRNPTLSLDASFGHGFTAGRAWASKVRQTTPRENIRDRLTLSGGIEPACELAIGIVA